VNNAQKRSATAATGGAQQSSNQHVNHNESPAAKLLSRLDKVKKTGSGQWLARCPAHDDGSPSLSVRETDDGTVLLHCFAQCPAGDVLAAVGMELGELFPRRYASPPKSRFERRIGPKDALQSVAYEATVVCCIAAEVREQGNLTAESYERLITATSRIRSAREVSC
jgi:hypothetical protein